MATFLDELLLGGKAQAKGPGVLRQAIAQERGRSRESHYAFFEGESAPDEVPAKASQALKQAKVEAKPTQLFRDLNGFSVELTGQEADQLRRVPTVQSVELDQPLPLTPPVSARPINQTSSRDFVPLVDPDGAEVHLDDVIIGEVFSSLDNNFERQDQAELAALPVYKNGTASTGEVLPYGIQAVWDGQDVSKQGNVGTGTYAFVIDSGVLDTTGDLLVNKAWSKSWIGGESAFTDGNGHGTHVAGTIAALANGVGVVGVAPGAEVISLKVFNSSGGGASYSTIISAINHAVSVINTNGLDKSKTVINMSLGGGFSSGLDAAVKNAADQGIQFAIAAGNSGDDADYYSPAAAGDHSNVYTVSAVDNQYRMSSWSNWDDSNGGDDVDVAAPGVSVLSYYQGGGLAYLSGTSMASPHVAGALLLGGVAEGEMVAPNYAGHADPFGLVALSQAPSLPQPIDPPSVPAETPSEPAKPTIKDSNSDGLVDGFDDYYFFDDGDAIALVNKKGKTFSDASSKQWDVIAAAREGDGYQALLDGATSKDGKYSTWITDASGVITKRSGWIGASQAIQLDWESKFNLDINGDGITGKPPVKDSNSDGLVDGFDDYYLFDDGDAIALVNKKGKTFSDASSKQWDVIAAVREGDGYQVLRDGAASKDGKYSTWITDASGVITKHSGWIGASQVIQLDWESKFNLDINGDGITGKPPVKDSNSDGLVDGFDDYYLFDDGDAIALVNKKGKTFSDASSKQWDVIAAVREGDGYQVLRDGTASKEAKYSVWTTDALGVITKLSPWKSAAQADELGWIGTFSDEFIKADLDSSAFR